MTLHTATTTTFGFAANTSLNHIFQTQVGNGVNFFWSWSGNNQVISAKIHFQN